MNLDQALLYPLAGLFAIVLTMPVLLFWNRPGWPRFTVVSVLLVAIVTCWGIFDLSGPNADASPVMFAVTLIPALVASLTAGILELKLRLDDRSKRRYKRKRRSASAASPE